VKIGRILLLTVGFEISVAMPRWRARDVLMITVGMIAGIVMSN
jgi:hypothetical protein